VSGIKSALWYQQLRFAAVAEALHNIHEVSCVLECQVQFELSRQLCIMFTSETKVML
jgi:hypothetical protein